MYLSFIVVRNRISEYSIRQNVIIYTAIKIVRLSVTVDDRGGGWLGVLGVVDICFGVTQPCSRR